MLSLAGVKAPAVSAYRFSAPMFSPPANSWKDSIDKTPSPAASRANRGQRVPVRISSLRTVS